MEARYLCEITWPASHKAVFNWKITDRYQPHSGWSGGLKWDGCIDIDPDNRHFCAPSEMVVLAAILHCVGAKLLEGYEGGWDLRDAIDPDEILHEGVEIREPELGTIPLCGG